MTLQNPERAEAGWPPAVIAGAFQTGVLAVRGLQRRGVRAVCFDSNPANPGFRSVYGPAHLCPNPDSEPDAWVRFMVDLSHSLGSRPALLASADQFVSAIARHADCLADHFLLSPGLQLQGQLADKHTQYSLAERHHMPMPRTQFVDSCESVAAFARNAVFPCLIKPIHFREWKQFPADHPLLDRKIVLAATPDELLAKYGLASSVNHRVILQEIIEGPDEAKRVYLSCYDAASRRIAYVTFRELRCDPLGFGPATVTEPIADPEVEGVCDQFLQRIQYVGICEIEVKRDRRDGRVKLIEANPRLSGGGDAAPYAGVDLGWLHYLDLIGQPTTCVNASRLDFRHIVLRADGHAIPAYRRAGLLGWRDLCRSYRPPLAFFDVDLRDWRYSAETLYVAARWLVTGLIGEAAAKS